MGQGHQTLYLCAGLNDIENDLVVVLNGPKSPNAMPVQVCVCVCVCVCVGGLVCPVDRRRRTAILL